MTDAPTGFDEDDESCPGEGDCDDGLCDDRRDFEVTWTYTVVATVRAHSQEEADTLAGAVDATYTSPVSEPLDDYWIEWDDQGLEFTTVDVAEQAAEMTKFMAQFRAAQADEALAVQLATTDPTREP